MKKLMLTVLAALLALAVLVAIAQAAGGDKGRRLTGPFCISAKTGVVRSVAAAAKCKPGELRKLGLGYPLTAGATGPAGATGAPGAKGDNGSTGQKGDPGAPGKDGRDGKDGKDGEGLGNDTTYLCVSAGGSVKWGGDDGAGCDGHGHDHALKVVIVR